MVFRTRHFSGSRGSILHEGIYSPELASLLASVTVAGALSLALFVAGRRGLFSFGLIVLVLIGSFPLFRMFLFRDRLKETVFDGNTGAIDVFTVGMRKKQDACIGQGTLEKLLIRTEKAVFDNPDAVRFVERISAQHGASLPELSEETTYYLLTLVQKGGAAVMIYADTQMDEVVAAHETVRAFLEEQRMLLA